MNVVSRGFLIGCTLVAIIGGLSLRVLAQDGKSEGATTLVSTSPDAISRANQALLVSVFTPDAAKTYPPTQGLTWHRNDYFSFFIPSHWHKAQPAADSLDVFYYPEADDRLTGFNVTLRDMGRVIVPDDLLLLDTTFLATIAAIPGSLVESRDSRAVGDQLMLEFRYVFLEDGAIRRRWVRVFYQGTRETVMTAQGASLDRYDYWLPWFYEAMATAHVHFQQPTVESLE